MAKNKIKIWYASCGEDLYSDTDAVIDEIYR